MQQMFYSGVPLLESVGLWEPAVCELRDQVSAALRQACGPLRAYAAEYEQYLELHNSDLESLLCLMEHVDVVLKWYHQLMPSVSMPEAG